MAPVTMEASTEMVDFVDLAHLHGLSYQKLDSFQNTRKDNFGLHKLVLIQNFMNNKLIVPSHESFEWTDEDVKKDEENWLDACLDGLDEEDEDGYVHIMRGHPNDSEADSEDMMDLEQEDVITVSQQLFKKDYLDDPIDMMIDYDIEHREFLDKDQPPKTHWRQKLLINERHRPDYFEAGNHMITTSVDHNYHHWKDKSVIRTLPQEPPPSSLVTIPSTPSYRPFIDLEGSTDLVKRSSLNHPHPTLCMPGFLRKYCLDRDYLVGINPAEIGDEPETSNLLSVLTLSSDSLVDLSKSDHHTILPGIVDSVTSLKRSHGDMDLIRPLAVPDVARFLEYVDSSILAKNETFDEESCTEKIWFVDDGDKRQPMQFL